MLKLPFRSDSRHPQHQVGEPVGGVEPAKDRAAAAMAASRCGAAASAAISAASRSRRECVLHHAAARRRRVRARRHWRTGPDRARAAAAPGSRAGRWPQLGDGRGAGTRDHQMARRHTRRQIGEKRRDLGGDRQPWHRPRRTRLKSSSRACCTMARRRRRPASSRPIAAGTISAMTRAPWLPPKTRSRNGSSAAG